MEVNMSIKGEEYFLLTMQQMRLHPSISRHSELLAALDYSLTSIKDLSQQAVLAMLFLHPIYVIKISPDRYQVVAGLRTFHFATRVFQPSAKIKVSLLENETEEFIATILYYDLFLTPLSFSLKHPAKALADIYKILPVKLAKSLLPSMSRSKTSLAKGLGVSTNTLYYRQSKRGEKK